MSAIDATLERWHSFVTGDAPDALDELLADDVVFYSPIVYSPQRGKAVTALYLQAAAQTFPGDGPDAFRYTKRVLAEDTAMLEFETTVDGKYVNGIDVIRCDSDGRIVEFRVFLRPLQAVNLMHEKMAAMLEMMGGPGASRD